MTYSRIAHHATMLFDSNRNQAYADAISRVVAPGSVVMDLGAGLGIHGLLAAAAGARAVYLVEPEPVVHAAVDAARIAGLADRIHVIQGRIEDAPLPEPVDVILSVFTGNLLFSEDLLPSLFFARDRHLKPGGKLLPDRAELWLAPIEAAALHRKHIARWSDPVMGFDYSFARPTVANEIVSPRREELPGSSKLSPGCLAVDLDFAAATSADCNAVTRCTVERSGVCHGLLGWIRMRLDTQWLSSAPEEPEIHWSPVVLPVDPPLPLRAGEKLHIELARPAFGEWTWIARADAGTRRHSSFLAQSQGPRELARISPAGRAGLSSRGDRARRALEMMASGATNESIARELAASGELTQVEALREVQALALKYGQAQ
jgi:SAM-dependent methyltransferase